MNRLHVVLNIVALTILLSSPAKGQLSAVYYGGNQSKVGLAYDMNDRFSIEARIYASLEFNEVLPEFSLTYKFINKNLYSVYSGLSFYSYLDFENYGPGIPIGTIITPVPFLKTLAFQIEAMPYWNQDVEFAVQASWGVRYYF